MAVVKANLPNLEAFLARWQRSKWISPLMIQISISSDADEFQNTKLYVPNINDFYGVGESMPDEMRLKITQCWSHAKPN